MKIYLAGGFTVINMIGRERELSERFSTWKRLFSFFFLNYIEKSEILNISLKDKDENT